MLLSANPALAAFPAPRHYCRACLESQGYWIAHETDADWHEHAGPFAGVTCAHCEECKVAENADCPVHHECIGACREYTRSQNYLSF